MGLDKRLVCCDSKVKKAIRTIECEHPLTACAFDLEGVTMAVGSSRGKVLIYDLRALKAPRATVEAHSSAVHSLQFQHRVERAALTQVTLQNRDFEKIFFFFFLVHLFPEGPCR